MNEFRNSERGLGELSVSGFTDYIGGVDSLPPSNVLKFCFSDSSTLVVRPSGTEPKIKIYISVTAKNEQAAESKTQKIKSICEKIML